jgi:hypothetical protein
MTRVVWERLPSSEMGEATALGMAEILTSCISETQQVEENLSGR